MNSLSIHSRLKALSDRKSRRESLLQDLRNGVYDGVVNASEYFRREEEAPQKTEAPQKGLEGFAPLEFESGRILVRRIDVVPGEDCQYNLGIPAFADGELPFAGEALCRLSPDLTQEDSTPPEKIAFLDTETTGLMGSTGTVAFLVGVGWWERPAGVWQFALEQYLIEDFCHEPALMEHLVARLAEFDVLCTYNGKSYDVPLLKARAILQRIPPRHFRHRQLDLLHAARRVWKEMLPSVSLKTVELSVLGIDRGPDLDGALIPSIFFHMARTGKSERMGAVVDHNAQDILTLGALLRQMASIARDPMGCGLLNHWTEFAGVARWMESRRELETAGQAWTRAVDLCRDSSEREELLLLRLAALHKKRRVWDEAVQIWESLRNRSLARSRICWVELAKYHERVRKDPAAALEIVKSCRAAVDMEMELAGYLGRNTAAEAAALALDMAKREKRLRLRLERNRIPKQKKQ